MERTQTTLTNHDLHLRVEGWVPDDWSERFDGLTQRYADDGTTVLCGELKDQSALFGILRYVESRGLKLVACIVYRGGAS
jgi:hypothetical protein